MAGFDDILDNLRALEESIFVAHPALVKEVYPDKMRADVVLKTKKEVKDETIDPPKIHKLPISHHKSSTFLDSKLPEKDDLCWVVFFDREIDHLIKDLEEKEPKIDRAHDESDAFIVGEWTADCENIKQDLGSMESNDWVIGVQRDTGSRIYIRKGGNIVMHPGEGNQIELVEDAQYHVPLYEEIEKKYNDHTHIDSKDGETSTPDPQWVLEEDSAYDRVKVDKKKASAPESEDNC